MKRPAPRRFFVLCENCGEAYAATLSRFTPYVCKKCGWDHGVRGTSLEYGDQLWTPETMPAAAGASPPFKATARDDALEDDGQDWEAGIFLSLIVVSAVGLAILLAGR